MFDRKLCCLKISVIALLFLNHGSEFDLFEGWIWSKIFMTCSWSSCMVTNFWNVFHIGITTPNSRGKNASAAHLGW